MSNPYDGGTPEPQDGQNPLEGQQPNTPPRHAAQPQQVPPQQFPGQQFQQAPQPQPQPQQQFGQQVPPQPMQGQQFQLPMQGQQFQQQIPYQQQPQGPTAMDNAQRQAQQLKAQAQQSWGRMNENLSKFSTAQLGFLPMLIPALIFFGLCFTAWGEIRVRMAGLSPASMKTTGFGYIGLDVVDFGAEEKDSAHEAALALMAAGILIPVVVVILFVVASILFRIPSKNKLAAFLSIIASVFGLYWVIFGFRSFANVGKDLLEVASDMISALSSSDVFLSTFISELASSLKIESHQTPFYWLAILVMIFLTGLSVILVRRAFQQDNPAAAQGFAPMGAPAEGNPWAQNPVQNPVQNSVPNPGQNPFPNNPNAQ